MKSQMNPVGRPLVLRVRGLRTCRLGDAMTQRQLADLAGITLKRLQRLETMRVMPHELQELHALALALQVPMEQLFHPQWGEDHRTIIEDRRSVLAAGRQAA